MFEIKDQTNLDSRCTEIVEHAAHFVIGDSINGFGVDDHFPVNNEVWNIFSYFHIAIMNGKPALLGKRNALKSKFNRERLLVRLLMKTMTQRIMNGKRATNNGCRLFDMNSISSICVHPVYLRLDFFKREAGRLVVGGGQ